LLIAAGMAGYILWNIYRQWECGAQQRRTGWTERWEGCG